MTNIKKPFGPAMLLASTLIGVMAGCGLYFGNQGNGNGSWNYCGSNGYYQCDGNDNCTQVATTCPSGNGYSCNTSADCAAGCYCNNGECTEGGFCGSNGDCGSGYHCDTARSSCEPGCGNNADCPAGETCDSSGQCVKSGCGSNGDCPAGETCSPRGQCVAQGQCLPAAVTCNLKQPHCPEHEVPTTVNGCWTGECEAISSCPQVPDCTLREYQDDCQVDTACQVVVNGIDCTTSTGAACQAGEAGCTCKSFVFASCEDKGAGSGSGG